MSRRQYFRAPLLIGFVVIAALAASAAAQQESIGVNFIGGVTPNPGPSIDPLGVAGVIAQSNWNNAAPADPNEIEDQFDFIGSTTGTTLVDALGASTPLVVSWQAEETFQAFGGPFANDDQRLMAGYIDVDDSAPRSTITLENIPYDSYDLFVYVGTDGNNRRAFVDIDNLIPGDEIAFNTTQRWFVTNTGGGLFTGPLDYVQATATTEAEAFPSNYIVYSDLRDPTLEVSVNRGVSGGNPNAGINGFQIVQRVPPLLLRVDPLSGEIRIVGREATEVSLKSYSITSDVGSLAPTNYRPLGSRGLDEIDSEIDADQIVGNSPGESWDVVFESTESVIEGFLLGESLVDESFEVSLGALYDPSFGVDESLRFTYSLPTGQTIEGIVEFLEPGFPVGDYNRDGKVDADDYTVWSESYGQSGNILPADGNYDGRVDAADYSVWREALASQPTAAVPEPSSVSLASLGLLAMSAFYRRFSSAA